MELREFPTDPEKESEQGIIRVVSCACPQSTAALSLLQLLQVVSHSNVLSAIDSCRGAHHLSSDERNPGRLKTEAQL